MRERSKTVVEARRRDPMHITRRRAATVSHSQRSGILGLTSDYDEENNSKHMKQSESWLAKLQTPTEDDDQRKWQPVCWANGQYYCGGIMPASSACTIFEEQLSQPVSRVSHTNR